MLDLVFAVDDPVEWHRTNLQCNRHHYSALKHLGHRTIARIHRLPAAVYYNTLIEVDSQVCTGPWLKRVTRVCFLVCMGVVVTC